MHSFSLETFNNLPCEQSLFLNLHTQNLASCSPPSFLFLEAIGYLQFNLWPSILNVPSVQFSHSVVSDFLRPQRLQHARPPCPSPAPGAYSNSCPLSQWCHPTISSPVVPFSSCLQSFPASGSFPMSQSFHSGDPMAGKSADALFF